MSEIELYREQPRPTTFDVMPQAVELARAVAATEFVPKGLRNRPEAVVAAILQGHELGLEPMASLTKIHVVDGRPTLAAELMRALVQRAGHEIWLEESSSTKVVMGGRRKGEEHPTRITWTIDDAKRAKLAGKTNWQNYPRAMLVARATGELCRILFADVLSGLSYTIEEVKDGFDLEGEEAEEQALAELEGQAETIPGRPADVDPPKPPTTTRTAPDVAPAGSVDESAGTTARSGTAPTRGRRAAPPAPEPPEPDLPDPEPRTAPAPAPVAAGDHEAGSTVAPSSSDERSYTPAQALAIRAGKVGLTEPARKGLLLAYTGGRTDSGKELNPGEIQAVFGLLEAIEAGELLAPELEVVEGESVWLVRLPDGTVELSSDAAEIVDEAEPSGGAQSDSPAETGPSASEPEIEQEGAGEPEHEADSGTEPEEASAAVAAAPEDVPEGEEAWRAFLRGHGVKLADVLRHAAALAGSPDKAPRSLGDLDSDRELGARVVAYIKGESS